MAAFKTHVTTGLCTGYLAGAFAVLLQQRMGPTTPLCILGAAFIGSFLPDLDSDHGKPFVIVFSILAMAGWGFSFVYFTQQNDIAWIHWLGLPPLIALFIRYGLGSLFKKQTVHRGIFHSIPALCISVLTTPFILLFFQLPPSDVAAISLAVGLGFLSHLLLDEIFSLIDFEGVKLKPKKSLGTAFSFSSPSKSSTITAYILLILLIYANDKMQTGLFSGLESYLQLIP